MEFVYPPEAEAFRAELRGWLEANLSEEERASAGLRGDREAGRRWARKLFDAGYACIA